MTSVGPWGRDTACDIGSSSFGDAATTEVGEQWTLFGDCPTVEGTHCLLKLGDGLTEGGGVNSLVLWTPAVTRSTSQLAGCPPGSSLAPGVPLTPGGLHISSILLPPSASTAPTNK